MSDSEGALPTTVVLPAELWSMVCCEVFRQLPTGPALDERWKQSRYPCPRSDRLAFDQSRASHSERCVSRAELSALRLVSRKMAAIAAEFLFRRIPCYELSLRDVVGSAAPQNLHQIASSRLNVYVQCIEFNLRVPNPAQLDSGSSEVEANQKTPWCFKNLPALKEIRWHVSDGFGVSLLQPLLRCLLEDKTVATQIHELALVTIPNFSGPIGELPGLCEKLDQLDTFRIVASRLLPSEKARVRDVLVELKSVRKLQLVGLRKIQLPSLSIVASTNVQSLSISRSRFKSSPLAAFLRTHCKQLRALELVAVKLRGGSWEEVFVTLLSLAELHKINLFALKYSTSVRVSTPIVKERDPRYTVDFSTCLVSKAWEDYHALADLFKYVRERLRSSQEAPAFDHAECSVLCPLSQALEDRRKLGKGLRSHGNGSFSYVTEGAQV